ncbi:hypothetical protein MOO46_03890 [Apilactobacillus apisilvae]|uniref:Uncharacterized protein n=1 Tax=Apilactobacillus apisilvae TaxID=2923364 RepID=A0ABY4PFP6_9LACO|nr:hypothetical protein [Apilactobacillus apisilvae]UQS84405.1 hypothetical protein MOO46_03890 [Apilactobacillus apisilvae]
MNNDDDNNRIKKYDFNEKQYNTRTNQASNFKIWPIIIFIVVIAALIIGGVKAITYFTSDNSTKTELSTSNKTSKETDENKNSNANDNSNKQQKNKSDVSKDSNETENKSQNNSVQNDTNKKESNNKSSSSDDMFAEPHTFSSVADAQSYAKTTQSQWLNNGYKTYTVSADSQGFYTLKFIK